MFRACIGISVTQAAADPYANALRLAQAQPSSADLVTGMVYNAANWLIWKAYALCRHQSLMTAEH